MDSVVEQDPRRAVARLAVAVMASDGRLTTEEIASLGRLDALGLGSLSALVEDELERATRHAIDLRPACAALAGASREAAHAVLGVLADIATSDRELTGREQETFEAIARLLGVPERESAGILAASTERPAARSVRAAAGAMGSVAPLPGAPPAGRPDDLVAAGAARESGRAERAAAPDPALAQACRVLGVGPDAGRDDVDAAYLAIVGRYDAAALAAMGAEFVALAVRRLAEATAAWELLAGLQVPEGS